MRPITPWVHAEFFSQTNGKEMSNVFWFKPDGTTPPAVYNWVSNLASAIQTAVEGAIAPFCSSGTIFRGTRVEVNLGLGTFSGEFYGSNPGTGGADAMPDDVALVVRKHTVHGGRSGTGRWRFGGLAESVCANSRLDTSLVLPILAMETALIAVITSDGVNYTPYHWSPTTVSFDQIFTAQTDYYLGTERRRRARF